MNKFIQQPYKFSKYASKEYPSDSKAAKIRAKLDNNEKITDDEKLWLTENCVSNYGTRSGIMVIGWMIPFSHVMKLYWYETITNGISEIHQKYAYNRTMLRKSVHTKIHRIVDIEEYVIKCRLNK